MLKTLQNIGVKKSMDRKLVRQIRLTNALLLFLIAIGILFLLPIIYENGWIISTYIDIFSIVLFCALLFVNYLGYLELTRMLTSVYPTLIALTASILVKVNLGTSVVVYDFIDARIIMVGFFVVPFILFSNYEKKQLSITLIINLLLVLGFDPIHDFFGVGYTHFFGTMPKAYIVTGFYIDIVYVFLIGSIFYFKFNIEQLLQKNYSLTHDLGKKNIELSSLFEELEKSNEVLKTNEKVISNQKIKLKNSNKKLSIEVSDKTNELNKSNKELVRHNIELQQFSNTLSHNLRGPVANLLGLAQLFKMDKSDKNRDGIADHIYKSAETLDGVIKDLNKIVELRNNLFQIKEKIEIKQEIDNIWQVLGSSIKKCNGTLITTINAPVTYGVRSYFHSILYNLLSNAIKYRAKKRDCVIQVTTFKTKNKCVIIVQDNGIGVDLDKHRGKMFGMYNRFHTHLEGKGLGLFLTKQQIEAMGGSITVESELNVGTTFTIKLPKTDLTAIESQLFYKSKVADIYLDAINDITTLVWKRMPKPHEFKEVFSNNIEVFSSYNSDKWIIDLSAMLNLPQKEKQWILDNAINQYITVGIPKIAIIRKFTLADAQFWQDFEARTNSKSLKVTFVNSQKKAKENLLKV